MIPPPAVGVARFRPNLHCPLIWMVAPVAVAQQAQAMSVLCAFTDSDSRFMIKNILFTLDFSHIAY